MSSWVVLPEEQGIRLDHVLERLMPDTGLRGRRRACASGLVTVNGHPARESFKVRAGDVLALVSFYPDKDIPCTTAPLPDSAIPDDRDFSKDPPRLLQKAPPLAFLYKPSGLHSVSLSGLPGHSLEALLPHLMQDTPHAFLLNRLDQPTSGIIAVALDAQGENLYHEAQESGHIEKRYLALLEGKVSHSLLADLPLDTDNRECVRVLPGRHPDPRRHTTITPLTTLDSAVAVQALGLSSLSWQGQRPSVVTLAGCTIVMGARHQIRAHCAALGFPLLGDRRYGASLYPGVPLPERFFLHHALLCLAGQRVQSVPLWLDSLEKATPECVRFALDWLQSP